MNRFKSPMIVFAFVAIAISVAISIDYTDTYVADRFHKTLTSGQYEVGVPISLDRFIEYYDWDRVYVVLPVEEAPELKTRVGLPYRNSVKDNTSWSLVFVKADYVIAEVPIKRSVLEYPLGITDEFHDRWSTIITLVEAGDVLRMEFVGQ